MKTRFTYRLIVLVWLMLCFGEKMFAQVGVISTARTSPRGIISFSEATTTGIGSGKYIDGYVKKYGSASFTYPVGDNGILQPFVAAADGTVGAYFHENPNSAPMPAGAPFAINNKDQVLARVNSSGFWDIDGGNSTRLTLSWGAATGVGALTDNNLGRLTIAGWSSANSRWENITSIVDPTAAGGGSSSLASGSITTSSAIVPNSYNVYTLAQIVSGPLPVTLMSFTVTTDGESKTILNWRTTFETNTLLFDVEHSSTGKSWTRKGSVLAGGESDVELTYQFIDNTPVSGVNLYRLKMLDQDSTFTYSKIQSITFAGDEMLSLYPNPTADRLYYDVKKLRDIKNVTIYGLSGQIVYSAKSIPADGMDVKRFSQGTYIVKIVLLDGSSSSQRIVVNK